MADVIRPVAKAVYQTGAVRYQLEGVEPHGSVFLRAVVPKYGTWAICHQQASWSDFVWGYGARPVKHQRLARLERVLRYWVWCRKRLPLTARRWAYGSSRLP